MYLTKASTSHALERAGPREMASLYYNICDKEQRANKELMLIQEGIGKR
jgi:hypothetical protein